MLWISDSPETPTGYGNVARFVCAGLVARGHQVDILGWQATEPHRWEGCRIFPRGTGVLGADTIRMLLVRERPDAVVALTDVWCLPDFAAPHARRQLELLGTPWVLYYPIDGDTGCGLPPSWVDVLRETDVPVAMSEYGRRISRECGIEAEMIPHGVDCDVFAPPADREAAKAAVGAAGRFVILSDSRNQPRKLIPRLLDVLAALVPRIPNVLLHLHTDPDDEVTRTPAYSYDVRADVARAGLADYVRFTPGFSVANGGIPLRELARYYAAADVHLLTSSGEGFGLPTLQAAAAGAVPVAGAYSASRELVEGHGIAVEIDGYACNEFGIRRATLSVSDAAEKIAALAADRARLAELSRRSREFALPFAWPKIIDRWDALLHRVAHRRTSGDFSGRAATAAKTTRTLPAPGGASVTVTMIRRDVGRLESAIFADVRTGHGDARIPVVPPAWTDGAMRVQRDQRCILTSELDADLAERLRAIFPNLGTFVVKAGDCEVILDRCASAILAFDPSGSFSDELLLALAALGTPAVGNARNAIAAALWPESVVQRRDDGVARARKLLTDHPLNARVVGGARAAAAEVFGAGGVALAQRVKRAHASHAMVAV